MAGIGIQLNRIFSRRTIASSLQGICFSVMYTIAPMLVIMLGLLVMYNLLGFDSVGYLERELFSCSVLYVFIFSLMFSSAINSTLSKYIADRIYEKAYDDIRPCMYFGLILKLGVSTIISVPFYLHEILVGKVPLYYVFTTYMCYMALTLVFALMLYGVVVKKFKHISFIFLIGTLASVLLSCLFRFVLGFSITYSMLLALTLGFWLMAALELYVVLRLFPGNSHRYRPLVKYLFRYWRLIVTDFLYIFGLFAHNFVFWFVPWRLEIVQTYICNQPYDMATCLAMFTNISATVLFISKVEMHFFERYSSFNSAVVGGSLDMIEKAKNRMFRSLAQQLQNLVQTQFAISVVIFLLAEIVLPLLGFAGMTMEIYPLMSVGYFISFLMYANILFLEYYFDYTGSALTAVIFASISLLGAIGSTRLSVEWYGLGYTLAALCAYLFSFARLRYLEKHIYRHIFCVGTVIDQREANCPDAQVYVKNTNG